MIKLRKSSRQHDIGLIGLGVMGKNFMLNLVDKGFSAVGYDADPGKVENLKNENINDAVILTSDPFSLVQSLRRPRALMMLVPAGQAVDAVIKELSPYLEEGDILIDAGNSYYKDTDLRAENLKQHGIHFLGVGVSGGEEGARNGPSIMPGGPIEAYERVQKIFEAAAAKVDGQPCTAYLGPGSAGHFVKMVHNGIEYGIMQLISEAYDFMKRGFHFDDEKIRSVFADWNTAELDSYLLEITAQIFAVQDEKTNKKLIDVILDAAKQKGTGMWTSQSAMELNVPAFTIDAAVGMRNMSMLEKERKLGSDILKRPIKPIEDAEFMSQLSQAYYAAFILVYAQGMAILHSASLKYRYGLNLETVARIWRGGCIIRSRFLERIQAAYQSNPSLQNLMLDPDISEILRDSQESLRRIVAKSVEVGIPIPGFMMALAYLDSYRSAWLPANLIQAQRDYFGAHTYERVDAKGTFHTEWEKRGQNA